MIGFVDGLDIGYEERKREEFLGFWFRKLSVSSRNNSNLDCEYLSLSCSF